MSLVLSYPTVIAPKSRSIIPKQEDMELMKGWDSGILKEELLKKIIFFLIRGPENFSKPRGHVGTWQVGIVIYQELLMENTQNMNNGGSALPCVSQTWSYWLLEYCPVLVIIPYYMLVSAILWKHNKLQVNCIVLTVTITRYISQYFN